VNNQLIDLLSDLNLDEFIALDLETTGLDTKNDNIIEISACRFINGKFIEDYSTLVNPQINIPNNIIEITGITNEMVLDAPSIDKVLPEILNFIDKLPIIGHNITFDYNFLYNSCKNNCIHFPEIFLYDTYSLARLLLYYNTNFSLIALCNYFDIALEEAHRAKSDSISTGKLFNCLIQELLSKPLELIQCLEKINKVSGIAYNKDLFTNIVKVSIKNNEINGLLNSTSLYKNKPNYLGFNSGNKNIKLPDSPIDWFALGGDISSQWKYYEERKGQMEFVNDAYSAFIENFILVAEAGTGLGKSLAYLASGFFASKQSSNGRPLVVSTNTKNLQEQIFQKDIPSLAKVLDGDIKAVIYKGQKNYICKTRFFNLIENLNDTLNSYEYEAIMILAVWEWETYSGDINECNSFPTKKYTRIWSLVSSETGYCSSKKCYKFEGCYIGQIRNKINDSDIIIVNHSLFANELIRDNSYLPSKFNYVIDEAHNFSNSIREQLIQDFGVNSLSNVFNFFSYRKNDWKIEYLKRKLELDKSFFKIQSEVELLKNKLVNFFNSYFNYRTKNLEKKFPVHKHLYENSEEEFFDMYLKPEDLILNLKMIQDEVKQLGVLFEKHKLTIPDSLFYEYEIVEKELEVGITNFQAALDRNSTKILWSSFIFSDFSTVMLNSAPLKVNEFINENLLSRYPHGIFCSATLAIDDDFSYFNDNVGINIASLSKDVKDKIYLSPFYYNDQVKLFVFNNSVDIRGDSFFKIIAGHIGKISQSLNKRILVLCTSYQQIKLLEMHLERHTDTNLIVQKLGYSKQMLIDEYLKYSKSILIGTSSFWEGVDFPGDKVEILFIIKIPFSSPEDPLVRAQIKDIESYGANPFLSFQVPEATIKLRQGFGRLIRKVTDSGICIITDNRLYGRKYGKMILDALPLEAIPYKHIDTVIQESKKFF